jgi:hypothetical protein
MPPSPTAAANNPNTASGPYFANINPVAGHGHHQHSNSVGKGYGYDKALDGITQGEQHAW